MTWVKLDDQFPHHPKVAAAGPLGLAMHVTALCYCNQYLTDGHIPQAVVSRFLTLDGIGMNGWSNGMFGGGDDAAWELVVADIIAAGLWIKTATGYLIHDYLEYQPSRAQVEAERKQKRESGRLGGLTAARTRKAKTSNSEAPAIAPAQAPPQAPPQAESKPVPVPVFKEPSFLPTSSTDGKEGGFEIGNILKEVDAA